MKIVFLPHIIINSYFYQDALSVTTQYYLYENNHTNNNI